MIPDPAILVINCGSSSVKFALFADEREVPRRLWSGALDRIGLSEGRFRAKAQDGGVIFDETHEIPNHVAALDLLLSKLEMLVPHDRIQAAGHRVVHGGDDCDCPLVVTAALEARLRKLTPLAPLHLPHNLAGIMAVRVRRPELPQVASFDTAFHHALPRLARLTGLPRRFENETDRPARPLRWIVCGPAFIVAVFVGMTGYGVTIQMMTATPLAMVAYSHDLNDIAFVIQWHTLAMFAPAFFTGSLVQRFGVRTIMLLGVVFLGGCVVAALAGVELGQFWLGLTALGLGWNFTFIGASTLLTEVYQPAERAKVQAANDFLVFGTVASASLLSGVVLDTLDWQAVNYLAIPFLLAAAVAILWLGAHRGAPRSLPR